MSSLKYGHTKMGPQVNVCVYVCVCDSITQRYGRHQV